MRSTLPNIMVIALFILSIIAPITPLLPTHVAKAQQTTGVTITTNATVVNPGSKVQVNVTLDTAPCTQTNITVNITVADQVNQVTFNRSSYTLVYGVCVNVTYTAYLTIVAIGGNVRVLFNTVNVDTLTPSSSTTLLEGVLAEDGQKIVIAYGGAQPIEITFYKTAQLVILGRWHGTAYWIPRLCPSGSCGNVLSHYNPYEWVIIYPGAKPNHQYLVNVTIKDVFGTKLASKIFVFNATGTTLVIDDNNVTAFLDFLGNASEKATPWYIIGTDYNDIQQPGTSLTVNATIIKDITDNSTANVVATAPIYFFVSIAKWEIPQTLSLTDETFSITVYDADANLNTQKEDTYYYNVTVLAPDGKTVVENITLVETGPNTGEFVAKDISILSLYGKAFNETFNKITLNTTELRIDSCNGPCSCSTIKTIELTYHTGTLTVEPSSITLRVPQKCCPVQTLTLKINDADLLFNVEAGQPVAAVQITKGTNMTYPSTKANYTVAGGEKVPALAIALYMVGVDDEGNEMLVNLTAIKNFVLEFFRNGNIVQTVIPLDYLNWTKAVEDLRSAGYQPEKIMVIYYDIFNPNLTTVKQVFNVTISPVLVELERHEIPVAGRVYAKTVSEVMGNVTHGDDYGFVNGTAQIIRITVEDNASNTNCCVPDTINRNNIALTLVKKVGDTEMFVASGKGVLSVPLNISTENGWRQVGTCYIEVTNLDETGPNTGVFQGKIKIYSIVNGRRIAGCPSLWLDGAKLVVTYNSPSSKSYSDTATFSIEQATVDVTPTGSAKFGTVVEITVYDPDANLDNQVNDTTYIVIGQCCPSTGALIGVRKVIALHETAPNSSVFTGEFVVDESVASICSTMCIRYIDPTPVATPIEQQALATLKQEYANNNNNPVSWLWYYGSKYIPGGEAETQLRLGDKPVITKNVYIKPERGKVEVYYTMPQLGWSGYINATGKVIPASTNTTLVIVVRDSDQNKNSTQPDTISGNHILIKVGNIIKALNSTYSLREVELNITEEPLTNTTNITVITGCSPANSTGVFAMSVTLSEIASILGVNVSYLKGKTIEIIYQDPATSCMISGCAAAAQASQIVAKVKVYYEDPTVEIVDALSGEPKASYNCTCVATGQVGDVIKIIVHDIDLLDLVSDATVPVARELSFSDNFDLSVIIGGNVSKFYDVGNLAFAGYTNKTVDGVPIPVVEYDSPAVQIFCGPLGLPQHNYIVAPAGSVINVTYRGVAFATARVGTAVVNATETASINATKISIVVKFGGTPEATKVIKQGSIVNIKVPVSYDPVAASIYAGSQFTVVMYLVDDKGYYWWFDYDNVTVTNSGYAIATVSIPPGITSTLAPGTYTLKFYVVTDLATMKPLSSLPAATVTITVVSK